MSFPRIFAIIPPDFIFLSQIDIFEGYLNFIAERSEEVWLFWAPVLSSRQPPHASRTRCLLRVLAAPTVCLAEPDRVQPLCGGTRTMPWRSRPYMRHVKGSTDSQGEARSSGYSWMYLCVFPQPVLLNCVFRGIFIEEFHGSLLEQSLGAMNRP